MSLFFNLRKNRPKSFPRLRSKFSRRFELLEDRRLLANLAITEVYLRDSSGNRVELSDEGQAVGVYVAFSTFNLPAGSSYIVRRTMNGDSYDATLTWGAGNSGQGNWVAVWSLGTALAGNNTISVELDAGGTIAETSESDNARSLSAVVPDTKDPQFINPLGGRPNLDWFIGNLVDLDRGPGILDYRGNSKSYDGHDAHDINLAAGWEQQDAGTPIYAAAGGKITYAGDGGDDKCGHPTANQCGPSNGVSIDHGGGWVTHYAHMRKGSVAVVKDQVVATGQFLGFVGSSGNSSGPHLHWAVYHNGKNIEPFQRANELLADPVPYTGDAPSIGDIYTVLAGGTLSGRAEQEVFQPNESPAIWMATEGIKAGVTHDIVWYKPDGSEDLRVTRTAGSPPIMVLFYFISPDLGLWTISTEINKVKIAETKFLRTAVLQPEVKVSHLATNLNQVFDETTQPVRFEPTAPGQKGPTRTLTVRNVGNSVLTTSNLIIPANFTLVEGLSGSIDPGKEDTFTIQMNTDTEGLKSGVVRFDTNDLDESTFSFPIQGLVTTLSLSLVNSSVSESAGKNAVQGTVTRPNFGLSDPLTVYLQSDDGSEATLPLRITIPAGQQSANFFIDAIDDNSFDGNKTARITASLIGNVSASTNLTVTDNDTPALSLTVASSSLPESGGTTTATITRNTATTNALTVNLSSNDLSEATVPASVVIPVGATSITVTITAVNDLIADGDQIATISASATGLASASVGVTIVDDEVAALGMSINPSTISENGGTATATVTRNTPTNSALQVNLSSSDTSAATVPATITIPAGATSVTFSVLAVNDATVDGPQSATIQASASGLNSANASITVNDDEVASLGLSLQSTSLSENGGSTTATVSRNTPTTNSLLVNLSSNQPSAATVPTTVTIPAGANSVSFTITAVDDLVADGNQLATITATALGHTAANVALTVTDDENPSLGLTVASSSLPESGGTTTATITRNTATTNALTVNLSSNDLSEATVPASVVIPAGATSITFTITAFNDLIADGDQVVTISANTTGLASASVGVTIVDDEVAALGLSINPSTISENGGTATATVTRNTPINSALQVNLSSSDTLVATVPATVTIPAGATSVTFSVLAVNDASVDGPQSATIQVSASGLNSASASITVNDDEVASLGLSLQSTSLSENGGSTTATVSRNTPTTNSLLVNLSSSQPSAATVPTTVTIPAGANSVSFTITAVDDLVADGNQLATITATALGHTAANVALTVSDDESPALGLTVASSSLPESGGTTTATITRNTATTNALTVNLSSNDLSEATVPASVVIPAGATSITFTITAFNDLIADGDQVVTISANTTGLASASVGVTIVDDEVAALGLSLDPSTISENGGTATATVTRNTPTNSALQVNLSSSDTSAATVPATINIPAGATSVTFSVLAVNDAMVDGPQSATIQASASGLNSASASITVNDDEVASLGLSLQSTSLSENGGSTTATVTRNTPTTNSLLVNLSSSQPSAATVPTTVTIPAGANSVSFTITAVDDSIGDGNQLATITATALGHTAANVALTVTDDESPALSLTVASSSLPESGGTTTATITRNTATTNALTVNLSSNDLSEATVPASVVIPAGATSITFTITAFNDLIADGDQVVTISANTTGLASASVGVTIVDDEVAALGLSINPSTISENGGTATATVTRNTPTNSALQVNLSSSDTLVASVPATVTIPAGATSVTFSVLAVNDATVDGPQSATIQVSASGLNSASASITVNDDDIPGIILGLTDGTIQVNETGTIDEVLIQLSTRPSSNVVLAFRHTAESELKLNPREMVFTSENWNQPQTLTLTGLPDLLDDGDQLVSVQVEANDQISANEYKNFEQAFQVSVSDVPINSFEVLTENGVLIVRDALTRRTVHERVIAPGQGLLSLSSGSLSDSFLLQDLALNDLPLTIDSSAGNDVFTTATIGFRALNGGDGFDRFRWINELEPLDITQLPDQTFLSIERIDLTDHGINRIIANPVDLPRVFSAITQLSIKVGKEDEVILNGSWKLQSPVIESGEAYHELSASGVSLRIANGKLWTNPIQPMDLDRSGDVQPLDALLVINYLNLNGSVSVAIGSDLRQLPDMYVDVDGNERIEPLDALLVINFLNRSSAVASPEPPLDLPFARIATSIAKEASRQVVYRDTIHNNFVISLSGTKSPKIQAAWPAEMQKGPFGKEEITPSSKLESEFLDEVYSGYTSDL